MKQLYFALLFFFIQLVGNAQKFDSHLKSVSPLKEDNDLYNRVINEATSRQIELTEDQLDNAEVATYDNSSVKSVSLLNDANPSSSYIAYFLDDNFCFLKALITSEENITNYEFTSLDDELYYSVSVNSENRIGRLKIGIDVVGQALKAAPSVSDPSCPKQYPKDWSKCMNCAVKDCYSDWKCALMCSVGTTFTISCFAGFSLACAGVGVAN